jgi:hypothetical protein
LKDKPDAKLAPNLIQTWASWENEIKGDEEKEFEDDD